MTYEIVTPGDLNAAIATFDSRAKAQTAADGALPRRTRPDRRPMAVQSGWHSARAGHDVWIVWAGNAVMLRSGLMYDHQLGRVIR